MNSTTTFSGKMETTANGGKPQTLSCDGSVDFSDGKVSYTINTVVNGVKKTVSKKGLLLADLAKDPKFLEMMRNNGTQKLLSDKGMTPEEMFKGVQLAKPKKNVSRKKKNV